MATDFLRRSGIPFSQLPDCPEFRSKQERVPDFLLHYLHLNLRDTANAMNSHSLGKSTSLLLKMTGYVWVCLLYIETQLEETLRPPETRYQSTSGIDGSGIYRALREDRRTRNELLHNNIYR